MSTKYYSSEHTSLAIERLTSGAKDNSPTYHLRGACATNPSAVQELGRVITSAISRFSTTGEVGVQGTEDVQYVETPPSAFSDAQNPTRSRLITANRRTGEHELITVSLHLHLQRAR